MPPSSTAAGRDLLVETARYWAGRVRLDPEGRGHLYGVMGPDEYHEVVDDNAYTNVMARWNLRTGAAILARSGGDAEVAAWRELADSLVDGWSPETGIYEQFAGYFDLEPLLMSEVAPPPVAVDLLLGPTRVAGSQLLKQADVLMLHHLVPEETVAGSLGPLPRVLRAPHRARQLALPRDPRLAPGARRGARSGARAVPPGRPSRPRRPDRDDRGGSAPGHHGRGLAGPRLRVPRTSGRTGHPCRRPAPARGLVGPRPALPVPGRKDRRAGRARSGHGHV